MKIFRILLSGSLLGLPLSVWANANASAVNLGQASSSTVGSLLQVVLALAVVLGLILGAGWLMRRFSLVPGASSGQLRVISGVMVGPKERVVIVEVQNQWLVLGVTGAQVNLLHTLDKPENYQATTATAPPFAQWLQAAIEKRKGGQ